MTKYIKLLASTRIWLGTSERGDTVGARHFEVLASGRAMLLCDRNAVANGAIGLVEGVHAAMFNSTDEFLDQIKYYLNHEPQRLAIVRAARELALSRHLWHHRASQIEQEVRSALWNHANGATQI